MSLMQPRMPGQGSRPQNPVHASGCGFKSHLRHSHSNAGSTSLLVRPPRSLVKYADTFLRRPLEPACARPDMARNLAATADPILQVYLLGTVDFDNLLHLQR